jgi:hypothetical protein
MLLQELSQILVAIEDRSTSQEVIEEKRSHEKHLQQILAFDHPCESAEETKEPWEAFNGEKALEPEIEEFLASLCPDPLCIQERNQQTLEYMHGMTKEDMQNNF